MSSSWISIYDVWFSAVWITFYLILRISHWLWLSLQWNIHLYSSNQWINKDGYKSSSTKSSDFIDSYYSIPFSIPLCFVVTNRPSSTMLIVLLWQWTLISKAVQSLLPLSLFSSKMASELDAVYLSKSVVLLHSAINRPIYTHWTISKSLVGC